MKDISVACGVSIATVSKALNDHDDIGTETKERIKQKAKEMGYFPNSAAKALKTNRTYNLGVLFVDRSSDGLTHDYYAKVLDSFKRTADEKGYDITFINADNSRMSYLEHCRYRGFDGVIIATIDFDTSEAMELVNSDIPLVTIDHLFNDRCAVTSDNAKGMRDLVRYIYEMGHRKIAYIHGQHDTAVTRSRLASFYRTCEELGLDIPDEYVREASYRDTAQTFQETERLLDLKDPPTCIIYPDDFASLGGLNAIHMRGMRIPDEISVAGYDGIVMAEHIEPPLTTIKQDAQTVGTVAAEKLIDLIENPKTAMIEQIVVEGILTRGRSVADIG